MDSRHYYTKFVFIFDLDDTLYKEIDFVRSAFSHIDRLLVADYEYKEGLARQILNNAYDNGINPFNELNAALENACIKIPDAIKWMVDEYRFHIPQIKLTADAAEMLPRLRYESFDMYIITDGRSITQRNKIRALGLNRFVPNENIFISEEIGYDKTNPAAFNEIYSRYFYMSPLNLQDIMFVFVGDNPTKDFVVGNTMGYPTFMLMDDGRNIHKQNVKVPKDYKPMHKVKTIKNILDILI